MPSAIGKRKRVDAGPIKANPAKKVAAKPAQKSAARLQGTKSKGETVRSKSDTPLYIQVVTGSYERVLHGLSARIPQTKLDASQDETSQKRVDEVTFTNSFLFAAHSSAIRCLALSPPTEADKCLLATGSSDERINVYSLSTTPPAENARPNLPTLTGTATAENPRNKSLGSLTHHDRAITTLQFPTKSKLFSAAEDATVSISRTRDWTVLSSIKAPIPKPQGRPSGDTAGPGEVPAGVNDFAIHPSQKLMLSVGRGERCMRLWNLMTGKKAGVLNFDRDLLIQSGESKFSSGEGRRVMWDETGENYVIGFERGAALFGIDSKPKAVVRPSSKIHQMRFLPLPDLEQSILAVSTEDGRVLFYDVSSDGKEADADKLPQCPCVAQLGGAAAGISGRVKDFEVMALKGKKNLLIVTGSSDGAVRLWTVSGEQSLGKASKEGPKQVGKLVATQETGNRITCLGAFVMDGKASDVDDEVEVEENGGAEEDEEDEEE